MPVRSITTARAKKYSLANQTLIANGGRRLLAMSRDRSAFYATRIANSSGRNELSRSTDGGTSWTVLRTEAATTTISGLYELPDGEVLMSLGGTLAGSTTIRKSTGWAANPATATFAVKLSMLGGALVSWYSLNGSAASPSGIILAAEEGPQTTAPTGISITAGGTGYTSATLTAVSGGAGEDVRAYCQDGAVFRVGVLNGGAGHTDGTYSFTVGGDGSGATVTYTVSGGVITGAQTNRARRVYLSTDFGETFAQIFDVQQSLSFRYGNGMHVHGVAYDESWDRIWVLFGDNTGDGSAAVNSASAQIAYTDDRGATWALAPALSPVFPLNMTGGKTPQFTGIRATADRLLLSTDAMACAGSVMIPKTGYRTLGTPRLLTCQLDPGIFHNFWRASDAHPMLLSYAPSSTVISQPVLVSSDGLVWDELWRETDLVARPPLAGQPVKFFGPDTSNRMLGNYEAYASMIQGTLVTA